MTKKTRSVLSLAGSLALLGGVFAPVATAQETPVLPDMLTAEQCAKDAIQWSTTGNIAGPVGETREELGSLHLDARAENVSTYYREISLAVGTEYSIFNSVVRISMPEGTQLPEGYVPEIRSERVESNQALQAAVAAGYDPARIPPAGELTITEVSPGVWDVYVGSIQGSSSSGVTLGFPLKNKGIVFPEEGEVKAELVATYAQGTAYEDLRDYRFFEEYYKGGLYAACPSGQEVPALPETGECEDCVVEFAGQSRWNKASGGPERVKFFNGEVDTATGGLWGEVSTDGFGVGADAWEQGDQRTTRLFAATREAIRNATYVITAEAGGAFDPSANVKIDSPGGGQLQGNGYKVAVEGAEVKVSEDGKTVTITVDYMPANSSLSVNVPFASDGENNDIYLNHHLVGTLDDCVNYSKSVDKEQVAPGDELTYTLTFENTKDQSVPIAFRDDLRGVLDDAELLGDSITSEGFAEDTEETTLDLNLSGYSLNISGVVPANSTATVTYKVKVNGKGDKSLANTLTTQEDTLNPNCDPEATTETPVVDEPLGSLPGSTEGSLAGSSDDSDGSSSSGLVPGVVVGGIIGSLVGSSIHGSSTPDSSTPDAPKSPGDSADSESPSTPEDPQTPDSSESPADPADPQSPSTPDHPSTPDQSSTGGGAESAPASQAGQRGGQLALTGVSGTSVVLGVAALLTLAGAALLIARRREN